MVVQVFLHVCASCFLYYFFFFERLLLAVGVHSGGSNWHCFRPFFFTVGLIRTHPNFALPSSPFKRPSILPDLYLIACNCSFIGYYE